MKILDRILKKSTENENLKVNHLYSKNGVQIGEYSLGVEEITYVDGNGNKRTKLVWTAQR